MRKLMSLALALVMSLALAAPVAAAIPTRSTECLNCGITYSYEAEVIAATVDEVYGVEEIPELQTTSLYTEVDSGNYCTSKFCAVCTDSIAQAYLASLNTGDISSSGSTGSVPVALTAEAAAFSVTVPTSIPMSINSDAEVTCATNLSITNNTAASVEVTNIEVQSATWSIVDYNGGDRSSLASEKVNSNKLGLALTPDGGTQIATSTTGNQNLTLPEDQWVIPAGGNLPFECAGIATAVSASASNVEAAKVVFTLAWKEAGPTLISFTVGGTSYQAEEGMTWEEWVNSDYNTDGFIIPGPVMSSGGKPVQDKSTGINVLSSATIRSGAEYIFGSHSG